MCGQAARAGKSGARAGQLAVGATSGCPSVFRRPFAHTLATERRTGDANPGGVTVSIGPLSPAVALVTKLVAKPDEADEVSAFLADAVRLANQLAPRSRRSSPDRDRRSYFGTELVMDRRTFASGPRPPTPGLRHVAIRSLPNRCVIPPASVKRGLGSWP